jgi:transketolase
MDGLEPFADKWRASGWNVISADGHDFEALIDAFEHARNVKQQPTVIIARTVKGKGISFMENNVDFHGKPPSPAQLEQALKELA